MLPSYDAASFLREVGRTEEAAAMLKSGIEPNPTRCVKIPEKGDLRIINSIFGSLLLNLTLAELEESKKKDGKAIGQLYDTLIANLEANMEEINAKYDIERDKLMATLSKDEESAEPDDWDGERREREREKQKERQKEVEQKVEDRRKKELDDTKKALSMAWIVYMRASRRMQVGNHLLLNALAAAQRAIVQRISIIGIL